MLCETPLLGIESALPPLTRSRTVGRSVRCGGAYVHFSPLHDRYTRTHGMQPHLTWCALGPGVRELFRFAVSIVLNGTKVPVSSKQSLLSGIFSKVRLSLYLSIGFQVMSPQGADIEIDTLHSRQKLHQR